MLIYFKSKNLLNSVLEFNMNKYVIDKSSISRSLRPKKNILQIIDNKIMNSLDLQLRKKKIRSN